MRIIADFQIHSRFSRACSKNINLDNLEKYARIKGIDILGTGDFQHPKWFEEITKNLEEDDYGILKSKTGFSFLWQTEVSLMYTQDKKGRRIHYLIFSPGLEISKQIIDKLGKKGRLDYDGRPIFGFSGIELVEMMMEISKDIEIIGAHVWTPWFGMFGSKTGFDSIQECFKEKSKYIHAIETGLSSDPAMNWRLSWLDDYAIVSFSDAHSFYPWRLGREATMFDCDLKYKEIINSIRNKTFMETIEVPPDFGKYHYDGHRNCNIILSPYESKKYNNICPVCNKPLTIGVLNRVEELADREEGYKPKHAIPFRSIIPLSELIAAVHKINQIYSKKVWDIYNKLILRFNSEFNVLLNVNYNDLKEVVNEKLASVIIKNREGKLKIKPGYDGVYGEIILDNENKKEIKHQKSLSDF